MEKNNKVKQELIQKVSTLENSVIDKNQQMTMLEKSYERLQQVCSNSEQKQK